MTLHPRVTNILSICFSKVTYKKKAIKQLKCVKDVRINDECIKRRYILIYIYSLCVLKIFMRYFRCVFRVVLPKDKDTPIWT